MIPATDLVPLITAESAACDRFADLLESERQMLVTGNLDGLDDLVEKKNDLARELGRLAARRGELLAADGLSPDRAGMNRWLAAQPATSDARSGWSSLLSAASRARDLNRLNGELIQLRLQHSTQALEILLGNSTSRDLYGADGQNALVNRRRISDSA